MTMTSSSSAPTGPLSPVRLLRPKTASRRSPSDAATATLRLPLALFLLFLSSSYLLGGVDEGVIGSGGGSAIGSLLRGGSGGGGGGGGEAAARALPTSLLSGGGEGEGVHPRPRNKVFVVHSGPPLSLAQTGATSPPPMPSSASSAAQREGFGSRPRPSPLRILALGGSVTWGGGCLVDPGSQAYPNVLGRLLDEWRRKPAPTSLESGEVEARRETDAAPDLASGEATVVHNLALRGSGAFFPSMCVASMVREKFPRGDGGGVGGSAGFDADDAGAAVADDAESAEEEPDYDAILLEFNLNGVQGLRMLLWRLRRRYPSAVLVFVRLRTPASDDSLGSNKSAGRIADLMREVGGTMWDFGDPTLAAAATAARGDKEEENGEGEGENALFCPDGHHLSPSGHDRVARGLLEALTDPRPEPPAGTPFKASDDVRRFPWAVSPSRSDGGTGEGEGKGTWGLGDACHLWYHTGVVPPAVSASGGRLTLFSPDQRKFAFELPPLSAEGDSAASSAKVEFEFDVGNLDGARDSRRRRVREVPVYLTHMTYGTPGLYPAVDVDFAETSRLALSSSAVEGDISTPTVTRRTRIDPGRARDERHAGLHLTEMAEVGQAQPGGTVHVSVSNTGGNGDVDAPPAKHPFRIVGLSSCGACVEMGFEDYAGGTRYCRKEKCFV